MRNPKFASIASVALLGLLSSQAFAWSISGVVQDKATGAPLAGVKISSFNYPGIETVSADGGTFSLSDATSSLSGMAISSMNVQFSGNVLNINNVHANVLKVSMMNALGKVIYQRTVQQVHGTQTFDLSKYTARGVKFARINIDGASSSYLLTNKGALLKEATRCPPSCSSRTVTRALPTRWSLKSKPTSLSRWDRALNRLRAPAASLAAISPPVPSNSRNLPAASKKSSIAPARP